MNPGKWTITKDEDEWTNGSAFDSKEDAVESAPAELELKPGEKFWVGLATRAPSALGADLVVTALDDHAFDEGPEGSDGYDVSAEARKELAALLECWAAKHDVKPLWFDVNDVTEHEAPPAP